MLQKARELDEFDQQNHGALTWYSDKSQCQDMINIKKILPLIIVVIVIFIFRVWVQYKIKFIDSAFRWWSTETMLQLYH